MNLEAGTHGDSLEPIRATVQRQLGRRVRDFDVRRDQQGLILTGRTHTYYVKQLVQHLVMGHFDGATLRNDIDVTKSPQAVLS